MEIKIEKALRPDLPEILALQKEAFRSEAELYGNFGIQPLTQTPEQIGDEFGEMLFLKLVVGGRIAGSVRAKMKDAETCYIGKLVVRPDCQGQGYGGSLMREVERRFPEAAAFELFTGHRSEKNIGLYQKLGYAIAGTVERPGEPAMVRMVKNNKG